MLTGAIIPTLMHRIPLSPFHNQNGDGILYQTSPHKRSWKRPNKEVLLPMVLDNDECEVPMKDKRCTGLTCEGAYADGCDHTNTNAPDPIRDSFRGWSGNGMCVLKPFHKWSRAGPFPFIIRAGTIYYTKQAHTNDLGKSPTKKYYCQWCQTTMSARFP